MTALRPHHLFVAVLVIGGIGLGVLFVQAVNAAREAASQSSCRGRLGQLMLALVNYHDTYGSFPPAYVADADGKPMHSWRVLVLPFLEQGRVYDQYRFDEPWNSPHNRLLASRIHPAVYRCPGRTDQAGDSFTDYVVIVGPETPFPGARATRLSDMDDKPENTILLVEIAHSDIHWMEPRDLDATGMSYQVNAPGRPSISSHHPLGPAAVFADRITTYRLDRSLRPATVRALTTIAGREPVSKDALIQRDRPEGPFVLGEP